MEDNQIIDLFFQRDEQALVEARFKYGPRLQRSTMNILKNIQDAEECINDTLLKVWGAIPPARPDLLGAFIAKIARNLAINRYNAKNTQSRGGGEVPLILGELEDVIASPTADVEKTLERSQVTASINACLKNMDKVSRIVFVMRYFHGESILSIAARLNMSESKTKSMLFRVRKKLKAQLEKEGVSV